MNATKWNKQNHRKRHIAVKLGLPKPARMSLEGQNHYGAMMATYKAFAAEAEPIVAANRDAHARMFSFDARNGIENNEELYGRSVRQTRQKYAGDIHNFRSPGADCDCEVSEVEKGLLVSMGRNEDGADHNEVKIS